MIVTDFIDILSMAILIGFGLGIGLCLIGLAINGIISIFKQSV